MGVVSPVGEQGSVIAKTAALKAGWDVKVAGMQINRFCASGLEAVNIAAQKVRERLGRPGRRRRRREHVARADRLRRRRLGAGPGDQLRDRLRAAGHRRRPDRDARRLGAARTSTATRSTSQQRAAAAQAAGRFDRSVVAGRGRDRPAGARARRVHQAAHDARGPRPAQGRVRRSSARWASTRSRSRAIRRSSASTHVHTAGNSSGIVDGAAAVLIGSEADGQGASA